MSTDTQRPLSLYEKFDLVLGIVSILCSSIKTLVLSPFRGQDTAPTAYGHVVYHALRRMGSRLSLAQSGVLRARTSVTYNQVALQKGFFPRQVVLEDGTKAHWIGEENARFLMVYYHGGGYVMSAAVFHFQFLLDLKEYLRRQGHDFAVLFLAYDLAPSATYPRQLQQAVALLDHVVNILGRDPSTIFLGGDSAGGNISLGVLSHLSHPHPDIPRLDISGNLRGVVLLSPWVTFEDTTASNVRNRESDIINTEHLALWSSLFMGDAPKDAYVEPLEAPDDWWRGAKTDGILLVGGSQEIMLDDIISMARKLEQAGVKTTTVIAPKEPHNAPIVFRLMGYKKPGEQEVAIQSWLAQRLSDGSS